jgi:SAM-dependent methyltransferase
LYREFLSNANVDNSVVLDLGSGVGRDSVYLASKGFDVLACDFDQKALTRTQEMAKLYSIEDKVSVLKWDARDSDAFARALSSIDDVSRLKLVLGVRFCHKPLFAQIVKNLPKESDCFFAWFHFAKGCEHSKVGRPNKEKDLIAPKEELRSIFNEDEGFEILKDDVSFLSDGRPSANFIARRKIENART